MPPSRTCEIGTREEWILRLLYAPDEEGHSRPLYGRKRLMKAMFLLQRKLEENFEKSAGFDFTAKKYGPYDSGVARALDCLTEFQYVRPTREQFHSSEYEGDELALTPKGKRKAGQLYDRLSEREQQLLHWVKYKQSMRSLGALMSYVYMEYPEMTADSTSA
ncbi:hypothetical protein NGM10_16065 (plasmid) [Halorussus salilacus]|uniref:hypothetical protein n=1 Tax=Halorussus salilacus TaxID=2953750 RepID=UPI0020A0595C|nr:hypothetical protein [Halorussus salilacus]USZ69918.1 hypothetical protein NGM10_16065 [Halorussus salilacus]